MKKLLAILLAAMLCLSLCACPVQQEDVPQTNKLKQVHITAGKIEPGMTAKDVFVEVTIDNQPVACRVRLTGLSDEGYWEMADDEKVSDPVFVRLDLFYSLPKGCDVDDIEVTMECDGGECDGTGSVSFDEAGNVEAWSHAIYGGPTQEEPQPVIQPTVPPEAQSTTPPKTQPTTPSHTHSWTEQPLVYVPCTTDSVKTYTCSCGETKKETVPAPGHDWKEGGTTQSTCTEPVRQTKTCRRCGAGFINETPATGHSWSAWVKENGRQHKRTCSTCGAEETANHNIPSGSVTCTDCGADIVN